MTCQAQNKTNIRTLLPQLLPKAMAWAECQSEQIASTGNPPSDDLLDIAQRVGVQYPELIRIKRAAIPKPACDGLKSP